MELYNKSHNYIGNSSNQHKLTKYFYKKMSGINYSAFIHDHLYGEILLQEHNPINRLILKLLFDIVFLVMGFFRCLFNFQIYGCIYTILFYTILVISTPYYLWTHRR